MQDKEHTMNTLCEKDAHIQSLQAHSKELQEKIEVLSAKEKAGNRKVNELEQVITKLSKVQVGTDMVSILFLHCFIH